MTSRFRIEAALRKPEVAKLQSVREHVQKGEMPSDGLAGILKVEFPGDAEIMSVSCDDDRSARGRTF